MPTRRIHHKTRLTREVDEPPAKPAGARTAALRVLADLRQKHRTARAAIDAVISRYSLSSRELALTTELVMGIIRHRLTLTRVLSVSANCDWRRIKWPIQHVLMLGAYQLIWLDGIPTFAAVNEAVEQAKTNGGLPAGRLVNAVLRQLLRDIEHRRLPSSEADPTRAIPIDGRVSCQFKRPILPDATDNPIQHLAWSTSHPVELVTRWVKALGLEPARQLCHAGIVRPPTSLRPNGLRTDLNGLIDRLRQEGVDATPSPCGRAVIVDHAASVIQTRAFADGWFQPQDRTAMQAVEQMDLVPGQVVLDLCAGLGTKATQMAEVMKNAGTILACDKDMTKLEQLTANCRRLGHTIVKTISLSELEDVVSAVSQLDWILIDVPCSNSGVLARRPEARYRFHQRVLKTLATKQLALLTRAAQLAGDQTRLLYATCSIDPEENERVCADFETSNANWKLVAKQRVLPAAGESAAHWQDGGFWASWAHK